jgi:diadenosine tetraphosphate (Ap4A) HIT family hydrolase
MALVAEAVYRSFAPRKLNYELLGNSAQHAHWHIFPRYESDPHPTWPVWNDEAFRAALMANERAPREQVDAVRERLQAELRAMGVIEQR